VTNPPTGPADPLDPSLDTPTDGERPCIGAGRDDQSLTVRAQVRIVTGGQARAVAAAQGNALKALLAALPEPPARTPLDEREQQ
jgi:hypothetical protein